jgi:hypothetical protein
VDIWARLCVGYLERKILFLRRITQIYITLITKIVVKHAIIGFVFDILGKTLSYSKDKAYIEI